MRTVSSSRACVLLSYVLICLLPGMLASCGLSTSATSGCDPTQASEVRSVNVENTGGENLQAYPIAIRLDQTNFDFAIPADNGADLAVWDATTLKSLPVWLESYDANAGKSLLWVKPSSLTPQGSQKLLLTVGTLAGCSSAASNGYSVFPFFSDVADVSNWQVSNQLSIANTITQGPLTIGNRTIIESDSMYNGFPGVAQAANGDFVLSYKKGLNHVNSPLVIVRRSSDGGATWTPEIVLADTSVPDPGLMRTPLGDLIITYVKLDASGNAGAAFGRSSDNGLTWSPMTFFDNPVSNTYVLDPVLKVGTEMYGAGYGPFAAGSGDVPSVWSSADDGFTWRKLSELRQFTEPGLNETALALTGPDQMLAIMRSDNGLDTFGRYSSDLGMTWGPLMSYTSQVGVLQAPQLIQAGPALILMGRQYINIPGVVPGNTIGYPRQLVAYVSYDGGKTFGYGTVLDTYTGQQIDGGYCWPILLPNGQVYVVYYGDSHNLRQPDIKSLTLSVAPPVNLPANSIHVLSELAPGLASHAVNINGTRYALEFRFRSNPTPAGSQFSVIAQGAGLSGNLVDWELPSTHAADPTAGSGIMSNGKFVQILDAFAYGQSYRLRTIVDEAENSQQPSVLDDFGGSIRTIPPLPLAQASAHISTVQIGNNSSLRATDTLLDFVFLRPSSQNEPTVTVTNVK